MKLAWSNLARGELQALRRFSVERWGRDVAQCYLEDVRNAARRLGEDPRFAKPLKDQYRIFRVRISSAIFRDETSFQASQSGIELTPIVLASATMP